MEAQNTAQLTFKRCLLPWIPNDMVKKGGPIVATDTCWEAENTAHTDGGFWNSQPTWTVNTPIFKAKKGALSPFAQRVLDAKHKLFPGKTCYRVTCNWVFFPSTDGIAGIDLILSWVHPSRLGMPVFAPPLPADIYMAHTRLSIAWIVFQLTSAQVESMLTAAKDALADLSRAKAQLVIAGRALTYMDAPPHNIFPGDTWWKFKHSSGPAQSAS